MKINEKSLKNYCTPIMVFLPILGQYGFMTRSFTVGDLLIIPPIVLMLGLICIRKQVKLCDRVYPLFFVWFLLSTGIISNLIGNLFSTSTITSLLQNSVYFLLILLLVPQCFDCKRAYQLYSNVVIVLCGIVFVQVFLNATMGSITPWVINSKYFPAVFTNEDFFTGGYQALIEKSSYRPASLFSEPALFAQYVTPCFILSMFKKEKTQKEYIIIILVTISILLARSANGTVYLLVAWVFTAFYILIKKLKEKSIKIKSSYVLLACLVLLLIPWIISFVQKQLLGNDSFSILERLAEILDPKGESSGSMRVVRGWQIFFGLTPVEKIFGIGCGNIIDYLNFHPNIVKMFTQAYNGYMSGLSSIFVNMGLIGACVYLRWWWKYFRCSAWVVKGLQVFLLLYLLASNSFMTPMFLLTTVMVMSLAMKQEGAVDFS